MKYSKREEDLILQLSGVSYLLDLKDEKTSKDFLKILKSSKILQKQPRYLKNHIDEFIEESNKKYSKKNKTSPSKPNYQTVDDMADKTIKLFEKSLNFGVPQNYVAQSIITFIGNLALDGIVESHEFVYLTTGKRLKKFKDEFSLIDSTTKDEDIFKVVISFENPRKDRSMITLPPLFNIMQTNDLGEKVSLEGVLGTRSDIFQTIPIKGLSDLLDYFSKFMWIYEEGFQKIDTEFMGQRLKFARRYLAGLSQVNLSKNIGDVSSRSIGNWEDSKDLEPLWYKKNFSDVIKGLYIDFSFLLMATEFLNKPQDDQIKEFNFWPDQKSFEILNDWIIYGDSKNNRHQLPLVIKNFTTDIKKPKNLREETFYSQLKYYDWKDNNPPNWFNNQTTIDEFWISHWTNFFAFQIDEDSLFNLMDLLRFNKEEQERIHKIYWFIRAGNDNNKP